MLAKWYRAYYRCYRCALLLLRLFATVQQRLGPMSTRVKAKNELLAITILFYVTTITFCCY